MSFRASAVGFAAAALLLTGCAKPAEQDKVVAAPKVATVVAQSGTIAPSELLPGLIAPYQNVAIVSTLTEPAIAVNVQEGDRVHRGQVIAVLDTTDLRAQMEGDLAQAASQSASAVHTYDQGALTIAQSNQTVINAQAAVQQARQTLAKDSLDLSRYQQLLAKGYIAQQQVSTQTALVRNDSAAVDSAQATLRSAGAAVSANGSLGDPNALQASSVQQERALQKVALAQADQVRASIVKATIVSPIDGVVVNRNINVGEYPGTRQIFTLQQVDPIYAELHASGSQVANATVGSSATINSTDVRAKALPGNVVGVLNEINPGSTDFQIKVLLRNPRSILRPGMAIEGTISLPKRTGVEVPTTAFLDDSHDSVLVVGDDSTVKTVKVVETGDDGTHAVVTGLATGSRVISDGQTSIGNGQKVAAN